MATSKLRLPNLFILIDDDPVSNTLCDIILHKAFHKHEVQAFTKPEKGLDFVRKNYLQHPVETTIFLDINMPRTWSSPTHASCLLTAQVRRHHFTVC